MNTELEDIDTAIVKMARCSFDKYGLMSKVMRYCMLDTLNDIPIHINAEDNAHILTVDGSLQGMIIRRMRLDGNTTCIPDYWLHTICSPICTLSGELKLGMKGVADDIGADLAHQEGKALLGLMGTAARMSGDYHLGVGSAINSLNRAVHSLGLRSNSTPIVIMRQELTDSIGRISDVRLVEDNSPYPYEIMPRGMIIVCADNIGRVFTRPNDWVTSWDDCGGSLYKWEFQVKRACMLNDQSVIILDERKAVSSHVL